MCEEGERGGGWRREAGSAHQHHASVVLEVKRNSRADLLYRLEVRERGEERVEGGGVENRNGREEVLKEQRWKTKKRGDKAVCGGGGKTLRSERQRTEVKGNDKDRNRLLI